jgi:hypothetical protein
MEVFVHQVLTEEGLALEPNAEWKGRRIHDFELIWRCARLFFGRGAAVGFHLPNEFRTYWANTHRPRSMDELDESYRTGIVTTPQQNVLALEDHVHDVLADSADWVEETVPSQLTPGETATLREMTTNDPRYLALGSVPDDSLKPTTDVEEPSTSEYGHSGEPEGPGPDYCTSCGQEVGSQMTYCPTCGAKLVR